MSTSAYYKNPKMLQRLHEGPLGIHVDLFAKQLLKEGHCRQSAWRNLHVVCDFSHWLARKGLNLHELDERTVEQYLKFRVRYRHPFVSDRATLNRLLTVLRETNAIAPIPSKVLGPLEQIEEDFYRYLIQERGLARVSVSRHLPTVRQFLREVCPQGRRCISRLVAADITKFVERHAHDHGPRSAQMMCWTLRAFTRYLQYRGNISANLSNSVPTVRRWKLASLPTHLQPKQIERVLGACDRQNPIGLRDYAVLMLLARLGLRANEISQLTLDDLDWQSGQLTVQGKGGQRALLPLPVDVGAAIADYLQRSRPRSDSRRVFLRDLAPHVGFASSSAISVIASTALTRAGIDDVQRKGAHLFRHSLATQLLRAGASLMQIGQVLRHENMDSTRIYAKVDIRALRTLALPWPGGLQ